MGRIYQRADRVVAWIGQEPQVFDAGGRLSDATKAIEFVKLLYGDSRGTRYHLSGGAWRPNCQVSGGRRIWGDERLITIHHPGWGALLKLCHRSYWSRLWVIQELVLAPQIQIQCGHLQLEWSALNHIFGGSTPTRSH